MKEDLNNGLKRASSLCVLDICKSFWSGTRDNGSGNNDVLRGLSFEIPEGLIIGLVGQTGVGKSTLARIATAMIHPDSGKVTVGDVNVHAQSPQDSQSVRKYLRYVPQNPDSVLTSDAEVFAAIEEALSVSRLEDDRKQKWKRAVLDSGLLQPNLFDRRVGNLSLGERRRVVNIRGIVSAPKFLFLDEPFNGLDVDSRQRMTALLGTMCDEFSTGITIISHDLPYLREICHRVYELADGNLHVLPPEGRGPNRTGGTVDDSHQG